MDKNKVRCFVEEYFEEILSAISGRDDFEDLNVVDMGNFDDEFSGNSFKDNYDMVVENEIDIHRDWCMSKKFKVNLLAVLEEIEVEAGDYAEAYEKAMDMLSEIAKDVPIKNIVKHIYRAEMYDDNGSLKGSISNCMDELK